MTRTLSILRAFTCCLLTLGVGCGDDVMVVPDMGPPPPPPASLAESVAFEGMQSLVTEVTLGDGTSLEGATIRPRADAPLEVVESRCVAARCGLVVRVLDTVPNRGVGVPATIDAMNAFLEVTAGGTLYQALLPVRPLDEISGRGSEPVTFREPIILAVSATIDDGAVLQPGFTEPVRWVVFGDVDIAGSLDASPRDTVYAGGFAGGETNADGEGAGAGQGGPTGAGAGYAEVGESTADADGGRTYGDEALSCAGDFATRECGGSGGGGSADAPGGGGGGAIFIAALGGITGAGTVRATGGAGTSGSGGGSGGAIHLAASSITVADDVMGGASDTGGAGSAGRSRIDDGATRGFGVDLAGVPRITDAPSMTLAGFAPADAEVTVELEGASVATASADGSGAFTLDVPLVPGLNRLVIRASAEGVDYVNWIGTNIRFERVAGRMMPVPTSATVDVVRL